MGLACTKNSMKLEGRSDVHLLHVTQTPPRAHHPSHSCIVLALVFVVALPCSVVKEVYSLVFFLAQDFPGMGFLTFPSMIVTLPFESTFGSGCLWSM
jgi:hypothetical protein